MARLCITCDSLCVYFLIFLGISSVFSSSDQYVYDSGSLHPSDSHISLKLLDEHKIHKRDTQVKNQDAILDNRSNPEPPTTTTETVIIQNKTESVKPLLTQNYTTQILSNENLSKNLGENGTGIRKYTNFTVVSSTILPTNGVEAGPKNVSNSTATKPETPVAYNNITIAPFADIDVDSNQTLYAHNISQAKKDSHLYYNSTFIVDPEQGQHYWVDMENRSDVKVNDLLSSSHRRAATVKLSFDFPFYGHLVRNVTIATGGFLYTGDYVHSWLAATQYIAPLMANFDTSLSNDSFIKYVDNGTAFTVQWEKVALQDKPDEGNFTFQATLHSTGDIVFVYKDIPLIVENIQDDQHPVKVGLSDAYIIDHTIFFVRRKTIYEYHRVNFQKEDIKNWTVIHLTALPTCLDYKDCDSCLSSTDTNFDCKWCPSVSKCSDGLNRHRQEWLMKVCDKRSVIDAAQCSKMSPSDSYHRDIEVTAEDDAEIKNAVDGPARSSRVKMDKHVRMGVSGIVVAIFMVAMVAGLGAWAFYAYMNPHTASGQILIRYRPSQWRWRRGEPRYTVATIHM